jgi:hypothetical protein
MSKALSAKTPVITATEPWTEAAYATLPTPSMCGAYESQPLAMPPASLTTQSRR